MSIFPSKPRSTRRLRFDGVFDIECSDWTTFSVAATYQGGASSALHRTLPALVDHLLSRGGTWWAHCGGTYDFLAVAEVLRARGVECTLSLSGSRVSQLIVVGGGLTLRDSYCLVPFSLDVAAKIAGLTAPILGLRCECFRSCGGYCMIGKGGSFDRIVDAYCLSDARTLHAVLVALQEHADEHGYHLRGTLGGTAWATAKATLDLPDADYTPQTWRHLREGYVGGRVTVVRPRATGPGAHVDIASAYPAALAITAVPVGQPKEYGAREAALCLDARAPGVYSVTVDVPETLLPPLPWRHADRLAYPTGTITGTWVLPELEAALERGVKIVEVHACAAWSASEVLFGGLMHDWYRVRTLVGRDTPLGQWQALLGRSLTGKLAEAPERRAVKMHPSEIKICIGKRPCSRGRCTGACGAYQQIDTWGKVWSVPFYRQASSGHLHWAAYLTAATRVQWLEGAERCGDDLVYGDTDSIWTQGRALPEPIGNRLGDWTYKHGWRDWECKAPKCYRYTADDGQPVVRASGATHLTDEEFRLGRAEREQGVHTFIDAATADRGLFRRKQSHWTAPGRELGSHPEERRWYGDRRLDSSGKLALPVSSGQIREKATLAKAQRPESRTPDPLSTQQRPERLGRAEGVARHLRGPGTGGSSAERDPFADFAAVDF